MIHYSFIQVWEAEIAGISFQLEKNILFTVAIKHTSVIRTIIFIILKVQIYIGQIFVHER